MNWGVVAACGPDDREIRRVGDLLESVFHHEPATRWVAVIDSGDVDRGLADRFARPPGTTIVSIRNPSSGWADGQWGPLCVGVLAAYEWIATSTDARFVVKFDSDALVIAPFAAQIRRAMREHPDAGVFGSYKIDPNGNRRDTSGMGGLVRRLHKLALFEYKPKRFGRRFPLALFGRPAGMRRVIGDALRNGYEFGEHVSGGAYAATRELLDRMHARGYLARRHVWADSQISEDVMMGVYARACGLEIAGHAADGDAFGVKHVGLPDTPQRLLERGYSVIHSVKSDARATEQEIREFFRAQRLAHPMPVFPKPSDTTATASPVAAPTLAAASAPPRPVPAAGKRPRHEDLDDADELALGF